MIGSDALKNNANLFLEWLAVLTNVGFTILFQLESPWAFLLGIIGPLLLGILSYQRKLFADVLLQMAYIGLSVYGYFQFIQVPSIAENFYVHALGILGSGIFGIAMGRYFQIKTAASLPYLDSNVTTFSLWATFLLMSGFQSAWLYFIAINLVSMLMFHKRNLHLISLLFVLYTVLAIQGYFKLV